MEYRLILDRVFFGAAYGGILWWAIMVVNSLVWSACLTLIVFPLVKKAAK